MTSSDSNILIGWPIKNYFQMVNICMNLNDFWLRIFHENDFYENKGV